jgi:hypothetical protein
MSTVWAGARQALPHLLQNLLPSRTSTPHPGHCKGRHLLAFFSIDANPSEKEDFAIGPAALAARYKLPAVYYRRYFVTGGGLISYGPEFVNQLRLAARYVDRVLKG